MLTPRGPKKKQSWPKISKAREAALYHQTVAQQILPYQYGQPLSACPKCSGFLSDTSGRFDPECSNVYLQQQTCANCGWRG